eukprot:CAMPEP_0172311160 /NCGR_PEP_ID=MMETSP1058-20130122/13996_1 /TAXON_ID=83371 /ORGANISM="Detonula confervacea, Strain CCMP 353" /LENGTH=399 /DNA_ID=CAMNT_0013024249 /DNA_START=94 /DNA_END=1290 /DNA_ORIENTATION=+
MSSIIPNSSRATQSMIAIGTVIAAATSIYIIHRTHRRKRQSPLEKDIGKDSDASDTNDKENDFYEQLGISEENLPTHIQREIHKERKRKAKVELLSMKTPMYDNIYMLDTNREPMCTISMKKARWYLKKGIAEWSSFKNDEGIIYGSDNNTDEEVKCIRLLFDHNGSDSKTEAEAPETLYLRSEKQNICVCCGDDGHHIRHYIVPYSYRTQLPDEYKSHMSHDIVILCPDCHLDCEKHSKGRMKAMESDLRAKMGEDAYVRPVIDDPHLGHIRSCAIALVKWKGDMPTEKVERYEQVVLEYLASICKKDEERDALLSGKEVLTKSQLQKACGVKYRVKNPNFVQGAEVVVQSLKDAKSVEEFIIDWRKHFIATVNPQHMPTGWRIDNPVVCGSRKDGED